MDEVFDCIIVAAGKDLNRLPSRLPLMQKYLQPRKIFVIAPCQQGNPFSQNRLPAGISVVDENIIVNKAEFQNIYRAIAPQQFWHRENWYYQQFLKLTACSSSVISDCNNRLIWDADTIPLRSLTFFTKEKINLYCSTENHQPYFSTMHKLGIEKIAKRSLIAQSLPTTQILAQCLIEHLGGRDNNTWIKNSLEACSWISASEFSEYETLGNFQLKIASDIFKITDRKWSRLGYEIFGSEYQLFKADFEKLPIDFVAFESSAKERTGVRFFLYRFSKKYKTALDTLGKTQCLRGEQTKLRTKSYRK